MDQLKVLIVDGFSNHDWAHTTRCIQAILTKEEGFDVSVSTYPIEGSAEDIETWNPHFDRYDVVIQTCNNLNGGPQWPAAVETALESYVENGGGLFIYHAGNNSFAHWESYNQMIGLGWRDVDFGWAITVEKDGTIIRVPAGEGERTSHGPRIDALLTRLGDHPVHDGFPRQWVAADIEVYRYARGPAENLMVLSYAQDSKTGINFPIEWTIIYGKGQVYNSTLGHVWKDQVEPEGVRCAGFQTLLCRVVQWLGKREISEIPNDFPTQDAPRLRAYPVTK